MTACTAPAGASTRTVTAVVPGEQALCDGGALRPARCQASCHSFTLSLTSTNLLPLSVRPLAPVLS